jgi:catalase
MLQARLLSYPDAHRYRIGINYAALPVNKPRCPVHTYHRDGHMRFDGNGSDAPVYQPNSFGGPVEDPSVKEPPQRISGNADRYDHWAGNEDYYSQAGNLFRLMSADEKTRLIGNIVGAMQGVPREIQLRQIRHFYKADPAYGEGVAKGLGIDVKEAKAA